MEYRKSPGQPVRAIAITAILLLVLGAAQAADLTFNMTEDGQDQTMHFTSDGMCMIDADGTMIFYVDKELLRWFDNHEKTVSQITKSDLKRVSAMMGGSHGQGRPKADAMAQYADVMAEARKQAEKALEGMDEKNKELALQMLNDQFKTADSMPGAVKRTYEPLGTTGNVAGYTCKDYAALENGTPVGKICFASLSEMKIVKGDIAVVGKIRDFFADSLGGMPFAQEIVDEFNAFDPDSSSFIGIPISQEDKDGVSKLVSFNTDPVDLNVCEKDGFTEKGSPF